VRIQWAVSCESFDARDDGTADIATAGFDSFYVEAFPAPIEFPIVMRLFMEEGERGELDVHLLGTNPTERKSLRYPIEAEPGPYHRPGYLISQIESLDVKFPADAEGIYSVEIYTGGEAVTDDYRRSFFIYVRPGPPEDFATSSS
jgi:hypothetical protein